MDILADKTMFKFFSEGQIQLVGGRKFVFTDYRCQSSGVTYLCITGKQLVCHILVILSGKAFSDAVLHQTGQGRKHVYGRVNGLAVKIPVQNDLAFCDVAGQVGDGW